MTIINSLHILLCCRENCAFRQRCLLLCGEKKSCRLQKGKKERENNGAHTEWLVLYLLPHLEQTVPRLCVWSVWCVLPHPPLPPLHPSLPQCTAGPTTISPIILLYLPLIRNYAFPTSGTSSLLFGE